MLHYVRCFLLRLTHSFIHKFSCNTEGDHRHNSIVIKLLISLQSDIDLYVASAMPELVRSMNEITAVETFEPSVCVRWGFVCLFVRELNQ